MLSAKSGSCTSLTSFTEFPDSTPLCTLIFQPSSYSDTVTMSGCICHSFGQNPPLASNLKVNFSSCFSTSKLLRSPDLFFSWCLFYEPSVLHYTWGREITSPFQVQFPLQLFAPFPSACDFFLSGSNSTHALTSWGCSLQSLLPPKNFLSPVFSTVFSCPQLHSLFTRYIVIF